MEPSSNPRIYTGDMLRKGLDWCGTGARLEGCPEGRLSTCRQGAPRPTAGGPHRWKWDLATARQTPSPARALEAPHPCGTPVSILRSPRLLGLSGARLEGAMLTHRCSTSLQDSLFQTQLQASCQPASPLHTPWRSNCSCSRMPCSTSSKSHSTRSAFSSCAASARTASSSCTYSGGSYSSASSLSTSAPAAGATVDQALVIKAHPFCLCCF